MDRADPPDVLEDEDGDLDTCYLCKADPHRDDCPFAYEDSAEYIAYMEHEASRCRADYSTGGPDPYGTSCDKDAGHLKGDPYHEGPDPLGGPGRVRWQGGGSCAGDPLPYSHVEFIDIGDTLDHPAAQAERDRLMPQACGDCGTEVAYDGAELEHMEHMEHCTRVMTA